MERIAIYITPKAKTALEKIMRFNPDATKKDVISKLIETEAKGYTGRAPQKKPSKKPVKK